MSLLKATSKNPNLGFAQTIKWISIVVLLPILARFSVDYSPIAFNFLQGIFTLDKAIVLPLWSTTFFLMPGSFIFFCILFILGGTYRIFHPGKSHPLKNLIVCSLMIVIASILFLCNFFSYVSISPDGIRLSKPSTYFLPQRIALTDIERVNIIPGVYTIRSRHSTRKEISVEFEIITSQYDIKSYDGGVNSFRNINRIDKKYLSAIDILGAKNVPVFYYKLGPTELGSYSYNPAEQDFIQQLETRFEKVSNQ
jgi:hypothetical protein